jgi:hypothetical protein
MISLSPLATTIPVFSAMPPVALFSLALTSNCFAAMVDASAVYEKKMNRA